MFAFCLSAKVGELRSKGRDGYKSTMIDIKDDGLRSLTEQSHSQETKIANVTLGL